jgi:class 3 adenylate cyclase/tetratricopeptide (TPR) repeat protein
MNRQVTRRSSDTARHPKHSGKQRGSIHKIVVLFTDVVESSKYFKRYGDLAGREMLRKHQELASRPVAEHGGAVVKVLGDSVMAYFTAPGEALKAAVKIQQRFFRNNQGKDPKDQIRVRIGLHYGEGIVENGDIYGDVVNIAAKFLPLVQGGQIAVSQELHDKLEDISWARFERLSPNLNRDILKKVVIYRVNWDDKADLDPAHMTVLVFHPIWSLARERFQEAWNKLLQRKEGLWSQTPSRHFTLADGSLVLFLKSPSSAPSVAGNALLFLKKHLARDALPVLPLQILVDRGQFMRAGRPTLENLKKAWSLVKPGEITVSPSAFPETDVPEGYSVIPPENEGEQGFYRLIPGEGKSQNGGVLFLYQRAMVQGDHEPCFYCGDRRHEPAQCPSKTVPETTHGLERLGYMPLDRINEIFFESLNAPASSRNAPAPEDGTSPASENLAELAFFELKKVYQLRFLRTLWNATTDHWNRVQAQEEDAGRGGLIWIGQDCIRVSNLTQAEAVLKSALEKSPGDYRALTALGFVAVEKGDTTGAKRLFKQSLECANTNPMKIFSRFLLARVHELNGELRHAEEHIRKILHMDSLCSEALYQDMVYRFRKGNHTDGLRRLRKLIDGNRKYFVAALIDPDLADAGIRIHPELRTILERAGEEASRLSLRAEEDIEVMEKLMGEDAGEMRTPRSYLEKIRELSATDGYFNHLDVIHYATAIIQTAQRSHEQARRKLLRSHDKLRKRLDACISLVRGYPYASLLGSLPQDLVRVEKKTLAIRDVIRTNAFGEFKQALSTASELAEEMGRLEHKIQRLERMRRGIAFAVDFMKKMLLLEGAIVTVSLLLFPVVGHYLNFLVPSLRFSAENIWVYQKGVLLLGGGIGLFLAFLMSAKKLGEA